MKSARVRKTRTSSLHEAVASQRLPVSGKIRPGIKVLTKGAVQGIRGAQKIYDEGVAAGASFDEIEAQLRKANTSYKRRPLVPKNAPYFRVVQDDFTTPGVAAAIMDAYAEDRGVHGKQLYSFPVVFQSDNLDDIFREQFESWKASELFRWSEPGPNGDLLCMQREEAKPDRSKRKRWGGRPSKSIRECDPNDCDLFAAGDCKHIGTLYFWIPGAVGVGLISLTFTSIYASLGIAEIIDLVNAGLGRVKGTFNGKPIFRLSKVTDDVSRMDWEKGKATRQTQHIIKLEADGLDMVSVIAKQEMAAMADNRRGVALLEGPDGEVAEAPRAAPVAHSRQAAKVEEAAEAGAAEAADAGAADAGAADAGATYDNAPDTAGDAYEPGYYEPGYDGGGHSGAPQDAPSPEVKSLRVELSRVMRGFSTPWTGDDLLEWLSGNGYAAEDVHDEDTLRKITDALQKAQAASNANKQRHSQVETAADKPAPEQEEMGLGEDEREPF